MLTVKQHAPKLQYSLVMKQAGAYTAREGDEECFFTVLECGCTYRVAVESLFDADIPCPLHEEHRFYGDPPPPDKPHVET